MTRNELIEQTRRLVAEGDRLQKQPSLHALRTWLQLSDELLAVAWGSMDRYHLVWLTVGRSNEVRGRRMTEAEDPLKQIERAAAELVPQLTERLAQHGLGEIEVRQGDLRVRVVRAIGAAQVATPPRHASGHAGQPSERVGVVASSPSAPSPHGVTSPAASDRSSSR